MRDEIAIRKMIDHAERVIAYCEGYSYEEFLAACGLDEEALNLA